MLTGIDVQATLKAELDQDMEQYLVLGACSPQLAHQALEVERKTGLLLPCNVVVRPEHDPLRGRTFREQRAQRRAAGQS